MRKILIGAAVAAVALSTFAIPVGAKRNPAPLKGEGKNMKIVANVPYTGGTDMELTTIKGRDYAFAGSWASVKDGGGVHVIDITKPEKPKEVAWLKCSVSQGDIQISHNNKYVFQAHDGTGGPEACLGVGKVGFNIIDVRNPAKPKVVGHADTNGSHNTTAHPTKPYVYNSSSALAGEPFIQIWSVKNPKKPELVNTFDSLPHAPHDISFNKDGTMAVTAAISHFDIFDTSDPENPVLLYTGQCPGCSITHDAKFLPDDSGIVVGDEGGGGGGYPCPGGALYFYSLQGGRVPVLQGVYEPGEFGVARDGQTGVDGCTSHVFDFDESGKHIAISWYSAGTRYLDISAYTGLTVGDQGTPGGVVEAGWFMPDGGKSWSSKFHKGPYIFSNDMNRGFDVFKVSGK
ncbi:MAG TPA: hypothetical protein VE174_02145 [Actinomycetota bacterium]|nr:hypothetical protein [Actinomycetota bacterium]